jgi:hypothetical protein
MSLRATSHRSSRLRPLTVAVMAAALVGQLVAVSHEAAVRHFRCAEHGELTHIAITDAAGPLSPASDGIGSNESLPSDGHVHCASTFTVRNGERPVVLSALIRYSPPPTVVRAARSIVAQPGRLFVLASAPKTSPPSV